MAFFIVFGLLTLASFIILLLQRDKPRVGTAWAVALIASGLAWLVLFLLRLYLPLSLDLLTWQPKDLFEATIALRLDYYSWPYAIAVLTLCVASIFTETTIATRERSSSRWIASLILTSLTILSLASSNPLTLTISWALIDITELIYHMRSADPRQSQGNLMRLFAIRVFSTFALIFATAVAWQIQPDFELNQIPETAGIFFLLAAALRLGVLPIHLPFTESDSQSLELNFMFSLAPVASALALIGQLPSHFLTLNKVFFIIIQVLNLLAMLYSSTLWISRKNEKKGVLTGLSRFQRWQFNAPSMATQPAVGFGDWRSCCVEHYSLPSTLLFAVSVSFQCLVWLDC